MTGVTLRVHEVQLYQRHVTLRLPFRFGAATVTQCPQAFVRVLADVNGQRVQGASAELMVPKWFDKSPSLTQEQNFEQLRESLRNAREALLAAEDALSPHALSQEAGDAAMVVSVGRGLPRLAAQFGTALLDKAVADAALRAAGLPWVEGLRAGVLGDPWSQRLRLQRPTQVVLRHTVGLADRLTDADPGTDPQDGLPATLEAAIRRHGLHHFKLKLCGQIEADVDRLTRIGEVLQRLGGDYRVTLDGNETFTDATSDLLQDGVDLAIRFGALPDSSDLVARHLVTQQRIICAAPAYLSAYGTPQTLAEVHGHRCIVGTLQGPPLVWWVNGGTTQRDEQRFTPPATHR